MTTDWTIQSRSPHCAATGIAFTDGEYFYTLLFHEKDGFRREDLCEEAFKNRADSPAPFSFNCFQRVIMVRAGPKNSAPSSRHFKSEEAAARATVGQFHSRAKTHGSWRFQRQRRD